MKDLEVANTEKRISYVLNVKDSGGYKNESMADNINVGFVN